ncbi:MAG: hypothetical protein IJ218_05010 [Alphaproteobacteria bacterium]|nr:hypothetical protein [Alphaproteobacteria bacterium]
MKKLLLIALCAMFCLCLANAQNELPVTENEVLGTNSDIDEGSEVSSPASPVSHEQRRVSADENVNAQLNTVGTMLSSLGSKTMNGAHDEQQLRTPDMKRYAPIQGKGKFFRRNFIYQTLDISPTISIDNDPNLPDQTSAGKDIDENQLSSPTALGMNFGYSFIMVPGKEEDGKLLLNRMGFAYNIGLLASFCRQDKYGTTCNFLLKIGAETGNGHSMGIGFDVLGGCGRSSGDTYQLEYQDNEEYDLATPYTSWCWQYGMQLWMRTDMIRITFPNTEMLVFARFICSVDPMKDEDMVKGFDYYWKDETWSFGVTFRYRF